MQYLIFGAAVIAAIFVIWLLIFKILGLRVIKSNEVAVVEKWWSFKGSLKNSIIAINGEAGYLPDLLRGGIHFRSALMYKIHKYPLITVSQGEMAYVFARDGIPLSPEQTLGRIVPEANNFQDVAGFLKNGGQRGPQRGILREGTYAINLSQFIVVTSSGIKSIATSARELNEMQSLENILKARNAFSPVVIMSTGFQKNSANQVQESTDVIGIATVHDGPSIPKGEIIASDIGNDHQSFQDPEKFLASGGCRGKQLQVLTDGTYYINRLFATVELRPKTIVPIGYVGVVTSFYGKQGRDTTGVEYGHGQLVNQGCKGVLSEPLMPGKYAFNTDAGAISLVPTTNIILKWKKDDSSGQKYDADLAEVDIITKDAFEPALPLSVVMHIDYKEAPWVIQRFGDLTKLVNQSLDPLVSAYFKDIAQTKTLIELIQERSTIREKAVVEMKEKFAAYNLNLEEVLIGTPVAPSGDSRIENILTQLRERQIAEEQKVTYNKQKEAAETERALKEAQAVAQNQTSLTQSKISIEVAANEGEAIAKKAEQEANKIVSIAKADAERVKLEGNAEAEKEAAVGTAKATAIQKQVEAYGGSSYRLTQEIADKLSEAIKEAKTPVVPGTVVNFGGGQSGSSDTIVETLLKLITLSKVGVDIDTDTQRMAAADSVSPENKK
ncbi:MAG TPA: SPFH domain-containing protein [Ruminiclostridium sp.]|nr:SPFH domain-containing protein [Ruminiclostridium sp.]